MQIVEWNSHYMATRASPALLRPIPEEWRYPRARIAQTARFPERNIAHRRQVRVKRTKWIISRVPGIATDEDLCRQLHEAVKNLNFPSFMLTWQYFCDRSTFVKCYVRSLRLMIASGISTEHILWQININSTTHRFRYGWQFYYQVVSKNLFVFGIYFKL